MGTFGYNLRKLCEIRGLSPEQMAEKIGKSERTWLKIESGERDITRTEMKEVAKALEVPEDLILSLGERPIFNSFNNNQDGQYFNTYNGVKPENHTAIEQRLAFLEGKIEMFEKIFSNKSPQD